MAAASTAPARRAAATAPAPRARPTARSRASGARAARPSATRAAPRGRARPARRAALTPMPARLVPLAVGRTAVAVNHLQRHAHQRVGARFDVPQVQALHDYEVTRARLERAIGNSAPRLVAVKSATSSRAGVSK